MRPDPGSVWIFPTTPMSGALLASSYMGSSQPGFSTTSLFRKQRYSPFARLAPILLLFANPRLDRFKMTR